MMLLQPIVDFNTPRSMPTLNFMEPVTIPGLNPGDFIRSFGVPIPRVHSEEHTKQAKEASN